MHVSVIDINECPARYLFSSLSIYRMSRDCASIETMFLRSVKVVVNSYSYGHLFIYSTNLYKA